MSIRLFGTLEVRQNGEMLPRTRTRKEQWLLALLALSGGQALARPWLAGLLWPETPEEGALGHLRRSLNDLRRVLGREASRLSAPTPRSLHLDLAGARVDVLDFDAAVKKGDAASLERAVALYRGPLLQGCEEEWILPERQARANAYYGALETLAGQALAAGHAEQALPFLKTLVAADPLRESALRALMQALAARGDHAAVTQAYRDFRLYLHEAFHLQPDEETRALYEELREARTKAGARPRAAQRDPAPPLPASLTDLIGREAEVAAVCACLGRSRLVTLTGPGGTGKTRLAIAVGQQMRELFAEQVWFVSLAELPDAQRLAEAVRDRLGLSREESGPRAQVVRRLSLAPALLILDNYEHLAEDGSAFVADLLASVPSLVCLITSRFALNLVGETQYRVPALGFPAEIESTLNLLEYSSVQLFVERAAARRADFHLTHENAPDVVALCAKLEGIPLAIELVAAWADMLTPLQMRLRLEEHFAFPRHNKAPIRERHGSLQAVFDSSYALLDRAEQDFLCCLAVFAGGWTLEAAEAVYGEAIQIRGEQRPMEAQPMLPGAGVQRVPALLLLKRLVEKSLVVFHEIEGTGAEPPRYHLLELTRQYALERFAPEEREQAEQRHADYFLQKALQKETEVVSGEIVWERVVEMQADRENYYVALQRLKQTDPDKALLILTMIWTCGMITHHHSEVQQQIRRLAAQEMPSPSPLQAKLYVMAAEWAYYSTLPVWPALMEKGYALAEGCEHKQLMARALCHLGERDSKIGDIARARQRLEAASDYAQQAGDAAWAGFARKQLIYVACAENDLTRAQAMAEALLQMGREKHSWFLITSAFELLAHIAELQQDYPRARAYGEQALAAYPEGATLARSNMLRSLGTTATLQGDFGAARDYLTTSVTICQATDDLAHEAWSYDALASLAHRQGRTEEGRKWVRQALRIFESLGETGSMLDCLGRMARLSDPYPEEAAILWSAYERFLHEGGRTVTAREREGIAAARAALRATLPANTLTALEARSRSMSLREVIEYALECSKASER